MHSPSGRIDGTVHRFPLRIYFEDTDAAGIVYYANYLKFAERARSEWLRLLGETHARRAERGGWAVRRCEIDYLRPARLDDEVEVCSRLTKLGGASADMQQTVSRGGADLARLGLRLAFVGANGRPTRLPASLRSALQPFVQPQPGT